MTMHAHIDFETRSRVDIKKSGAEVYARDPSTEIMCLCYGIGDGPVRRWYTGDPAPADLCAHVAAGGTVYAHNAHFELSIWQQIATPRLGWPALDARQVHCTMAMARTMALPGALDKACAALNLPIRKDDDGYKLMLRLCKPGRDGAFKCTRDELVRLADYCAVDVEAERQLHAALPDLTPAERELWLLDWEINQRGVRIDLAAVARLIKVAELEAARLKGRLKEVTGGAVTNPQSIRDLRAWLEFEGVTVAKLDKDTLNRALESNTTDAARAVLLIRKEAGKASVAKLRAMVRAVCSDGLARGLFSYYGADTGRWAGRRVQPQNLPRSPDWFDGDECIALAMSAPDAETAAAMLGAMYGSALEAIAWCLRSLIKAPDRQTLIACDWSNIEGRILAWAAGEEWKLDAFRAYDTVLGVDEKGKELRAGPDLYLLAYSKSFGVPVDEVSKDNRQIGKVQELALGYQGGKGAFASMAANYGISVVKDDATIAPGAKNVLREREVDEIKRAWREAHPRTVQLWKDLEKAALQAVRNPGQAFAAGPVAYKVSGSFLLCRLPSGRCLSYPYPRIVRVPSFDVREQLTELRDTHAKALDAAGQEELAARLTGLAGAKLRSGIPTLRRAVEDAIDCAARLAQPVIGSALADVLEMLDGDGAHKEAVQTAGTDSKTRQWGARILYGGLLTENIVQAMARDILAAGLIAATRAGYVITMHVHDEIVAAINRHGIGGNSGVWRPLAALMSEAPAWARGLPLAASGWVGDRYRK